MKNYMYLRLSQFSYYRYISDYISPLNLKFLVNFFAEDYREYDKKLFVRNINFYNANFIYNDFINKIFYIGCSEWELDENAYYPSAEEFPSYLNETNSCKISHDNFIELTKKWIEMKKIATPFAIIYRDNLEWVHCKGFDSKEKMELFVKHYQPEETH